MRTASAFVVAFTFATVATGCAGLRRSGQPATDKEALASLAVFVEPTALDAPRGAFDPQLASKLTAALQAELGRAGVTVVGPNAKRDLVLRMQSNVRGGGLVTSGNTTLTVERDKVVIDMFQAGVNLTSESGFVVSTSRRLAGAFVKSRKVLELAEGKRVRPPSTASSAAGPKPEEVEAAKKHTNQGKNLFQLGRYQEALKEYEAAYLTVPHPVLLFNIGQCHNKLGNKEAAVRSYKAYLRDSPTASNRNAVEREIEALETAPPSS